MKSRAPGWRSRRLVSLDFETTGLNPHRDRVISFGAVPILGGRIKLVDAESLLIDPGIHPSVDSIKVHGLRPIDLVTGTTIEAGKRRLGEVLGPHPIVVWTAWVEATFLATTCGGSARRWMRRIIDVRALAVHLDEQTGVVPSPAKTDDLAATADRFGVPPEQAHDALADAFVTAELFLVVTTRLEEGGVLDLKSLHRLGRQSFSKPR